MRRLLIDTNVVLDLALEREEHFAASAALLTGIDQKKAKGFISALSITTIYYFIKKETGHADAADYIRNLIKLFSVVSVDKSILEQALTIDAKDYEDAVQAACALKCKAEYVVTRDREGFKKLSLPSITPAEFLAQYF